MAESHATDEGCDTLGISGTRVRSHRSTTGTLELGQAGHKGPEVFLQAAARVYDRKQQAKRGNGRL